MSACVLCLCIRVLVMRRAGDATASASGERAAPLATEYDVHIHTITNKHKGRHKTRNVITSGATKRTTERTADRRNDRQTERRVVSECTKSPEAAATKTTKGSYVVFCVRLSVDVYTIHTYIRMNVCMKMIGDGDREIEGEREREKQTSLTSKTQQ